MTDLTGVQPLHSGSAVSAGVAPAGTAPAGPGAGPPFPAPGPGNNMTPRFGSQLVRALELGFVTALGTFSGSPVATHGTITWRNYAAAGISAGFAGLWSVARALGYTQASQ